MVASTAPVRTTLEKETTPILKTSIYPDAKNDTFTNTGLPVTHFCGTPRPSVHLCVKFEETLREKGIYLSKFDRATPPPLEKGGVGRNVSHWFCLHIFHFSHQGLRRLRHRAHQTTRPKSRPALFSKLASSLFSNSYTPFW